MTILEKEESRKGLDAELFEDVTHGIKDVLRGKIKEV